MTRNDDFTRRLENYLDEFEGVTPLPDAVRDAIRAKLPHTKQIGPVAGLSRFTRMTLQLPASARYGLAAAAVLVAVVVGASIFSRGGTGGPGGQSPMPSSTASTSAAPSAGGPMSLVEAPPTGDLPVGEYYLDLPAYPARIEFEVPAGWWHYWPGATRESSDTHAILVNSEDTTGTPDASAWGLSFTIADEVPVDPCDPSAGTVDASATESVGSLAQALSSWQEFPTRDEDVTLGGLSGTRLEITPERDDLCDEPVFFRTPEGYEFGPIWPTSGRKVNQFTLLDVEGSVLVIWTTDFPATTEFEVDSGASPDPDAHVEDQAQLHDILDSIVIEPR